MARAYFRDLLKLSAPLVLSSLLVAGCGSGSNGVADTGGGNGGGVTVEKPVTVSTTYDFSAPLNYFVVGTPPIHARFLGGVAAGNGAWIVKEGKTATINFGTPADSVTFSAKDKYTAAAAAQKATQAAAQKVDAPFNVDMYLRGQIDDSWAQVPPEANKFQPTATDNVLTLDKTIVAGSYNFKVADAGWSDGRNCGGKGGPGTVVVGTPFTMNCANATGNDLTVNIAADDTYTITFDARGADKLAPILTFAKKSSGGGGGGEPPPTDSVEIRVFSIDMSNPSAPETEKTFKGTGTVAVAEARKGGDPRITRIEIQNLGTNGDVGIEDFTWTSNPQFSPATKPVDVYYRHASGGYGSTTVSVNGKSYPCTATTGDAYGCVVTGVGLYPYEMVNLSVTNGSSAAETIVTNADTATQPIYAFSGSPEARVGAPGETGKAAAVPGNANELIVFYKRKDNNYTGWGIHLYPKTPAGPDWTTWSAPYAYEGIDPAYGAYFRVTLPQNANPAYSANPPALTAFPSVLGFIIHKGDTKDPGTDQQVTIAQDGNMVFVVSGVNDVSSSPQYYNIVKPTNFAAHWVLKDTVLYQPATGVTSIDLLYSPDASLTNNVQGGFDGNYSTVPLSSGTNPQIPYLKDLSTYPAFSLPATAVNNAKAIARSQIYVVGKDANGVIQSVTRAQINGALDDLYYNAAKDVELGPSYAGGVPSLRVWAPTAVLDPGVSLQLYKDVCTPFGDPVAMTLDPATGVWSATGDSSWDRKFYTYSLKVYSPYSDSMVTTQVSDPYAVSGNTDGGQSQLVNLDDADMKPAGWDTLTKPAVVAPEDIVVYELHVRDFSIDDPSVPGADRGKYTAFDVAGTTGRTHLESLAAAGLTHVHILPSFDIASVPENPAQRVDIQDTVQHLCDAVPAAASYCFDPANGSKTIKQLIADYAAANPASLEPQKIEAYIRDLDGFNWGYDPYHYGSPEGSYSKNPNGAERVLDFRRMVKGLADSGLHTVMDVVYNHTAQSGTSGEKSVFDKIVPGYYQRRDLTTGAVTNKQCCNDMGSEWKMYEKLMFDTALRWVRDYKVDGFRFDIMAAHTKDQMQRLLAAAQTIEPGFYIYGEGWNTGGGQDDKRYVSARQDNLAGTGIGSFNDRIRDAIRGGGPFDSGDALLQNQGITTGLFYDPNSANSGADAERTALLDKADRLRAQLAGGIKTYAFENAAGKVVAGSTLGSYVDDPSEVIQYNENHDNETFWDVSQYKHPAGTPAADRVRAYNVGMSMVLLSQGVPFFEAGQEMLRSKSTDKNSYNSGDWFNELDWDMSTWNWGIGLPPQADNGTNKSVATTVLLDPSTNTTQAQRQFAYGVTKEWLEIRKSSQLFRLRTAVQIKSRMTMLNTGPTQQAGVVAYKIDGCSSAELDQQPYGAVVTIFNPTTNWAQLAPMPGESYALHPVQAAGIDARVKTATYDGTNGFRVPPRTTAVYVRAAQTSCSPYGVPMFVRGLGGDWTANPARELNYTGGTTYSRTIAVVAGAQQFKIADNDWTASSNCGGTVDGINVQVGKPLLLVCGNDSKNLNIDPAAGDYTFTLDATSKANPLLTVGKPAPFGSTTMYVRGGFNDWGNGPSPTAPMQWDNLSRYRAEIMNIASGTYDFKVADAGWSDPTNCGKGGSAPAAVTLGQPYPLTCGAGTGNISLPLATTGSYLFTVDGSNPSALQVIVEKMPFTAALYVRGLADDWSSAASNRMSYLGGGVYTYARVLAAGTDDFKIADEGWTSGTDCGSSSALGVGSAITLACASPGNGNINFTAPAAGRYEFTMDATNPTAPSLTATGP